MRLLCAENGGGKWGGSNVWAATRRRCCCVWQPWFWRLQPRTRRPPPGWVLRTKTPSSSRERKTGGTVYSGKLEGSPASFTVYGDQTVEFRCGDAVYGPYTAEQAPDAVPQEYAADESVTGVELFCAQELVFRGGAARWGDRLVLFQRGWQHGGRRHLGAGGRRRYSGRKRQRDRPAGALCIRGTRADGRPCADP